MELWEQPIKTSPTKINFNWETMKFENLTLDQMHTWEKLYRVDVFKIISEDITQWLDKKRTVPSISRKKNWHRFVCNWLKREQAKEAQ